MKKFFKLLTICFAFLLTVSCGSGKEEVTTNANGEKVLEISETLNGTGDKLKYFWQDAAGIIPNLTYRALLIPDYTLTKVELDLAKSFTISDDKKVYTFELKDNLKWSDGVDITGKDVEFSIKAALRASVINGIFPANLTKIVGAQDYKDGKTEDISGLVVEGNKITITLTDPVGLFTQLMAQFIIFPEHSLKDENVLELHNSNFFANPVTSGMYKVKEINPGNYIELERNTYYEGKKPNIDVVRLNYISDPILALETGKSDMFFTNVPNLIKRADELEGVSKYDIDILFYRYLIVNLSGIEGKGNSLVENVKVRQAIMHAIDKQALADAILTDVAALSYSGVPTNLEGFNKEIDKYEYNLDKAKQLLKEANYDSSKTLKLTYYYKDQTSQDFMQAISYQLNEAGIKNEVILIQNDPTTELFNTRKYDIAYKGLGAFGYESWYGEYTSNNTNFARILNDDKSFDELTKELTITEDKDKRNEILYKLQELEAEKLFKLPLFNIENRMFIKTDKIELPKDIKFGNPFYRYDYKFEDWDVK